MARRTLAALAVLVLLAQIAAGATAAAMLWRAPASETAARCQCPHGQVALVCPMHHAAATEARCTLRATRDADTLALGSLFGSAGVLPVTVAVTAPAGTSAPAPDPTVLSLSLGPHPDAPPPRG
jgi:hypothetical protein